VSEAGPKFHRPSQSFSTLAMSKDNDNANNNNNNNNNLGFSHAAFATNQPSISSYSDRHRTNIPSINTGRLSNMAATHADQTPGTALDMNFTPLLPSNLLIGSPFQPQSPSTFASPGFHTFSSFQQQPQRQQQQHHHHNQYQGQQYQAQQTQPMSPSMYAGIMSPPQMHAHMYQGPQSPTLAYNPLNSQSLNGLSTAPLGIAPGLMSSSSRTVYLGNIPSDTPAEEILSHIRSGQIESVRLLPDKNCAFISFLDGSSATHFHSDAILKKLCIKGQDIKIGWGKPSSVPTSVALAVQQSGASRNVYLGNLPEDVSEDELREDLAKFGPIDTVKIVREKAIGFVHFLSIGNAVKAVSQLPEEPKWQPPRRVYYGKDRCAYVSKTQQQNAAQYLGIAPGYAHVLNNADRDLISNALAQQSVAAAAVATTAGGVNNLGNRTVYLGNIHPETTIEEICNVVRGGLLHHVRYIPDKHICFVTFIDPTSAASFFALSNLQGLMIHNRRLKIGWGKHSGALPPAIALAVSGGASRNVYIGNLDETWTEERLRQDFSEYGEIELVNALREKSCAFVNFTNIANAIKAIEAVRSKDEYKRFKVNFGKDRCGNAPRQAVANAQGQPQQEENQSPSPVSGMRGQNSISPGVGSSSNYNPLQGPTASTILNAGANNPLAMYLAAASQVQSQPSSSPNEISPQFAQLSLTQSQQQQHSQMTTQQAFYSGDSNLPTRSTALEAPSHYGHHATHSVNLSNGLSNGLGGGSGMQSSQNSASRGQHSRTVSLPVFSQPQPHHMHQQTFAGLGAGLGGFGNNNPYGLAISAERSLPGWEEEEPVN
jgi:RNA recognition motif-containing protein